MKWKKEYRVPLTELLIPKSMPLFPFFIIGLAITYTFVSEYILWLLVLPIIIICLWLYVKYEDKNKLLSKNNNVVIGSTRMKGNSLEETIKKTLEKEKINKG